MKRVLAIGALLCALTGCGTVSNFQRDRITDATPYGGVKIAASGFNPSESDYVAIDLPPALCATDVALSAIGDTVTLPVTISLTAWRFLSGLWELSRPEEPRSMNNQWREFWFNEQSSAKSQAAQVTQAP